MKSQRKTSPKPREIPFYDPDDRELWFRGQLVKRLSQPADVQHLIFQAFQEQGWKRVIDDPLPPVAGKDPKEHLPQAITNLNRAQQVLHFFGRGAGTRIGWEPVE